MESPSRQATKACVASCAMREKRNDKYHPMPVASWFILSFPMHQPNDARFPFPTKRRPLRGQPKRLGISLSERSVGQPTTLLSYFFSWMSCLTSVIIFPISIFEIAVLGMHTTLPRCRHRKICFSVSLTSERAFQEYEALARLVWYSSPSLSSVTSTNFEVSELKMIE